MLAVIMRLYRDGRSYEEIARQVGRDGSTVWKMLKRAGVRQHRPQRRRTLGSG